MKKVAVVVSGYKDAGLDIVSGLCRHFSGDVILTARKDEEGIAAVAKLTEKGLAPLFHQLDVCNTDSIHKLHDYLKKKYGRLDILIYNARVLYFPVSQPINLHAQIDRTMAVNYHGVLAVCNKLFPLLSTGARVVYHSSAVGLRCMLKSLYHIQKAWKTVTAVSEVTKLVEEYVASAKNGTDCTEGWYTWAGAYDVSQLGAMALSCTQQMYLDQQRPGDDIRINCCDPGFARQESEDADPDHRVQGILNLALLQSQSDIRGNFMYGLKVVNWRNEDVLEDYERIRKDYDTVGEQLWD